MYRVMLLWLIVKISESSVRFQVIEQGGSHIYYPDVSYLGVNKRSETVM
jgi:hypothetical protein